MNMKKILLALGIGAGVGAACYFAKKKLDEMYYDMCAAPPYVPSPAGPAKRPAATAEKKPTPDAPAAEPVAEEEGAEPSAADGENLKERPAADAQETPAPEPAPAAGPESEGEGAPPGTGRGAMPPRRNLPRPSPNAPYPPLIIYGWRFFCPKQRILAFAVLGLSCKDLPRCPQRFALPFMPSGTLTDPT